VSVNSHIEKIVEKIKEGTYVFKVMSYRNLEETPIDMVSTYKDYEKKLYSHVYTPLLYIVSIHARIAYLYGCLNCFPNTKRKETFKVLWREIGKDDWNIWFEVRPYEDDVV